MKFSKSRVALSAIALYLGSRSRDLYWLIVPPPLPSGPGWFSLGNAASSCRTIHAPENDNLRGCEDMVEWRSNVQGGRKYLLLSCDPGRFTWNTVVGPMTDPSPRGDIWLYSYNTSHGSAQRLGLRDFPSSATFHPVGIDVVYDPQSKSFRVLVVNHGAERSTIEAFTSPDPTELELGASVKHFATLRNSEFVSPNSVVATSPTSFFVSNDHYFTRRLPFPFNTFLPVFETLFQRPQGWMDHVKWSQDPKPVVQVERVLSNIPFPNGVAVSEDGRTLAVASSTLNSVLFYDRVPETNHLTYRGRAPVPFHPDNLSFTSKGVLIAAGHPSFSKFLGYAHNKSEISPTWIVSISSRPEGLHNATLLTNSPRVGPFSDTAAPVPAHVRATITPSYAVQTLYQGDGSGYSAATTGLFDTLYGRMFAVGLYERGILECVHSEVP